MAFADITYTGDGSTLVFNIPFSYINESHLVFYVAGVSTAAGGSQYTATILTGGTTVQIKKTSDNSAVASGVAIKVERNTPITTPSVVFSNSSTLKATDLNTEVNQLLYSAQETADDAAGKINLDATGHWGADSKKIRSVADPVDAQDAVTKNYLESTFLTASDKTNLTAVSAVSTEMGRLGTADAVADMAIIGTADFVADINTVASADFVSDLNTVASADFVADMNVLATADVVTDMNTLGTSANVTAMDTVAGSITNVNTNATNIASINTNATNISAINGAATQASNAASSATAAASSQSAAASSATSAASSQSSATASASSATTSAGTATTKAAEASTSAASALSHKNDAETAKTAAETAQTAAAASQTASASSATSAASSATSAASSLSTFQGQYHGAASSDPTSGLDAGDLYFNTSSNVVRVYNGSSWQDAAVDASSFLTAADNLNSLSNKSTSRTNLGVAIGSDVQAYDADTLKADTADVLTAGFATTVHDLGTISSGTTTLNEANGNLQKCVNGGAFTLAPTSNSSSVVVQVTNNASAGAVTSSGFTLTDGDSIGTVNGEDYFFYCTVIGSFSHLTVKKIS